MKKEEIHLWDIKRILFGEAPPIFSLEVLLRTLIIYVGLLLIIRFLGKRMARQLTITEMSVMLTLGAIVSPAMQLPDRGLMLGFFVLILIAMLQRGLTLANFLYPKFERFSQGSMTILVEDGLLRLDLLRQARISHQQLFSKLRESEIYNLGVVERAYLEASGDFTIYKFSEPKPGLSLMPPDDQELFDEQCSGDHLSACANCGLTEHHDIDKACPRCGDSHWVRAII